MRFCLKAVTSLDCTLWAGLYRNIHARPDWATLHTRRSRGKVTMAFICMDKIKEKKKLRQMFLSCLTKWQLEDQPPPVYAYQCTQLGINRRNWSTLKVSTRTNVLYFRRENFSSLRAKLGRISREDSMRDKGATTCQGVFLKLSSWKYKNSSSPLKVEK